ncbi:unnamed protein product [Ascophyllum nodosum]
MSSSWGFKARVPSYRDREDGGEGIRGGSDEPSAGGRGVVPTRPGDGFEAKHGYSWDLCMVLPANAPDGALSATEIVRRLHTAGLETYLYYSVQKDEIICKIRASLEVLSRYAASVEYRMLLNESALRWAVGKGSRELKIAGRRITHDPDVTPYSPYECIYGKYSTAPRLAGMYARPPYLEHPFSSVHRIKLTRRIIESSHANGCGMNVSTLMANEALKGFFPFHDEDRRTSLFERWIKVYSLPRAQPLSEIKDYLGEKIALYFAFLGHYTTWLGPLSIVGTIMAIDQLIEWDLDAVLVPYFGVFVSFWAVFMLEYWKRQEARLAMTWGMSDFEHIEHDRAEFRGETIVSFIDGSPMTYYPQQEYLSLMIIANTAVVALMVLAMGLVVVILYLKVVWSSSSDSTLEDMGSYLASFLLSLEIQAMNFLSKKVAVWTNERENHRTDTVFEDVLIAKLAIFQFVNSYVSLFYIAFVEPFTTGCSYDSCLDSLCQSLGIIFCTRLFIANTIEVYLPRYRMRTKAKKERAGVDGGVLSTEAEVQYAFSTYDEMMGSMGDMSEISIQFGYVTLFVVAFPIAPLLAYISNYAEIRIDAKRVLYEYRRPFPRGAQDIGTWQGVLTAIATVAVATNAALILFTAAKWDWSGENVVWGFVVWQYCVFVIMAVFAVFVKDVPQAVSIQLERQKFITSKVIDQIPDEFPPSASTAQRGELDIEEGDDRPPPGDIELPKAWACC